MRALVIDDSRDAAESHVAFVAFDGPTGLSLAEQHAPDLVILDIGMPGMDGYEVCRRIRAGEHGAGILITALSGWGQPEDGRRTQAAGFNAHFVKPLQHSQLLELLCRGTVREESQCAFVSPIQSLTIDTQRLLDGSLTDPISFDGAGEFAAPAQVSRD